MATIFSSQWEGSGTTDSSTWDSDSGGGQLSVATDQYLQGTHSLKFNSANTLNQYITKTFSSIATIGIRVAIRIGTTAAPQYFMGIYGSGNFLVYLVFTTTTIYVLNAYGGGHIGSDYTYTANTWYQIEVLYTYSTSIKYRIWNAAGTSLLQTEQTSSTSIAPYLASTIYLGAIIAEGDTETWWLDSFIADNAAYPGSYTAPSASRYFFPSFHPNY
jgi:hypothetical protein